jgi:hypothetical protein
VAILTTAEAAIILLGVNASPDAEQTSDINAAIAESEAKIFAFIGGDPTWKFRTEVFHLPVQNQDELPDRWHRPDPPVIRLAGEYFDVSSVIVKEVHNETTFTGADELNYGVDYYANTIINNLGISGDGLIRKDAQWPSTQGRVQVQYTGGISETANPSRWGSLKLAATMTIRNDYQSLLLARKSIQQAAISGKGARLQSERIGDWSGTYDYSQVDRASGSSSSGSSGGTASGLTLAVESILSTFIQVEQYL